MWTPMKRNERKKRKAKHPNSYCVEQQQPAEKTRERTKKKKNTQEKEFRISIIFLWVVLCAFRFSVFFFFIYFHSPILAFGATMLRAHVIRGNGSSGWWRRRLNLARKWMYFYFFPSSFMFILFIYLFEHTNFYCYSYCAPRTIHIPFAVAAWQCLYPYIYGPIERYVYSRRTMMDKSMVNLNPHLIVPPFSGVGSGSMTDRIKNTWFGSCMPCRH